MFMCVLIERRLVMWLYLCIYFLFQIAWLEDKPNYGLVLFIMSLHSVLLQVVSFCLVLYVSLLIQESAYYALRRHANSV